MPATINQKLCMSPTGRMPVIHVGQYDSDFSIVFSLYSVGNAAWTMESGTTAKIRGTKTDGTGYSADCTVDVTNKKVTVTGDQQMTAAAGNCIYEIVLYKGTKELSSVNFILKVERAALDAETIPSESKIKEIQDLGTKADEIIEAYENLEFDTTPTAGSTKAVTSEGIKTAIDTVVSDVDSVRSDISDLNNIVDSVTETSQNLINEDVSEEGDGFLVYRSFTEPLSAGTYTVAIDATSDNTSINTVRIVFSKAETYSSSNNMVSVDLTKNSFTPYTFTVSNEIKSIFVLSATSVSGSSGYTPVVSKFQLEQGSSLGPYTRSRSAVDYKLREEYAANNIVVGGELSELNDILDSISETTQNLINEDVFEEDGGIRAYRLFTETLTAGTYTIGIDATSSNTSLNTVRLVFSKAETYSSSNNMLSVDLAKNSFASYTFTVPNEIKSIFILAGTTVSGSSGYTLTVSKLQLASGSSLGPYTRSRTAVDYIARSLILASTNDTSDRTSDITNSLQSNGYCKLGVGSFYTSGINMPDGTHIDGMGEGTKIILLDSASDYTIKMRDRCTVTNVSIIGGTNITLDGAFVGSENGTAGAANLWEDGNVIIDTTGYNQFVMSEPLYPGTYKITADITSDAPTNSYIGFSTSTTSVISGSSIVVSQTLEHGTAKTVLIDIPTTVYSVRFCSGGSVSGSSGYSGSWTSISVERLSARCGIQWSGSSVQFGTIDNCRIKGFSCAGIYAFDTGTPIDHNLAISNCFIENCNVGIYLRKDTEFNKITNCTLTRNYYGYLNRGGNNDICNSGIDSNIINIQIDSDEGGNNGHGTISNCSMNHANSNNGYGLIIKDTGRMLVSNCNFYYGKIRLESTDGNVITGCGFGRSAGWEVTDGYSNIFNGCMVRGWDSAGSPVAITNNSLTKIVNCFSRGGEALNNIENISVTDVQSD